MLSLIVTLLMVEVVVRWVDMGSPMFLPQFEEVAIIRTLTQCTALNEECSKKGREIQDRAGPLKLS